MPLPLLRMYLAMMPTLQAEYSLRALTEVAVGTGSLKKGEARRIVQRWKQDANQSRSRQVSKPQSIQDLKGRMASIGVGVN